MKYFALILALFFLNGCVYLERPMEPDNCWMCFDQGSWTMEDIHVQVNRIVMDKHYEVKRPQFNGTCLETSELKYKMAIEEGYNPEIVIVHLHEEVEYLRRASSPLHAVLLVDGTVYDNGFLTGVPFDLEELDRYGIKVPDTWSDYRRIK